MPELAYTGEINPMRFGGWCGVDMTWHAFGINPYSTYLNDSRPDWPAIVKSLAGRACGLIGVLDEDLSRYLRFT